MKFSKEMLLLYAVTDNAYNADDGLYAKVEEALKGGATLVQLRRKNIDEDGYVEQAVRIKELCGRYNVPLIINDNAKAAIKSGADGVHVGIEDIPVAEIRAAAPKDFIIGATAKTVEQAVKAEREGADYIGVGAVFPSPTKHGAIRITHDMLREICSAVSIPAVAIGGINAGNISELAGSGICGAAVVSAIFGAEDIKAAAEELKQKARGVVGR